MKRSILVVLLAAATLLAAPVASAVVPEKGSIAIFAAVGPSIPFEGDYKVGFHLDAGGEYYLSNVVSLRGTLNFSRSDASGGSSVTIGGLEAAAVYTTRRERWSPFVLGGFGVYSVDPPGSSSTQRLGALVGAGTDYFLDRRTALTGQLTGRFIGSAGGRTSSYAAVTFGVKYHF